MLCQVSVTVQVSVTGVGHEVQAGKDEEERTGAEVMLKGSAVEERDDLPGEADVEAAKVFDALTASATALATILFAALTIPPTTPVARLIALVTSPRAVGTCVDPPKTADAAIGTIVAVSVDACA